MIGTLRWLTAAAVAGLLILMLRSGQPARLSWWPTALLFMAWNAAPLLAPYWLARRFGRHRWFVALMTGYLILSTGIAGAVYFNIVFVSRSSTAALGFLFVPLAMWLGVAAVSLVALVSALVLRRHRARR